MTLYLSMSETAVLNGGMRGGRGGERDRVKLGKTTCAVCRVVGVEGGRVGGGKYIESQMQSVVRENKGGG